jgi:hypothetical protein
MDYLAQFPTYKKLLAIFTPAELSIAAEEFNSVGLRNYLTKETNDRTFVLMVENIKNILQEK